MCMTLMRAGVLSKECHVAPCFTINAYCTLNNIVGQRYTWSLSTVHKPVDLVKAVVIDDLHCLFLGVTKLLISLWFSKTYRSFDFYIGGKVCCFKL